MGIERASFTNNVNFILCSLWPVVYVIFGRSFRAVYLKNWRWLSYGSTFSTGDYWLPLTAHSHHSIPLTGVSRLQLPFESRSHMFFAISVRAEVCKEIQASYHLILWCTFIYKSALLLHMDDTINFWINTFLMEGFKCRPYQIPYKIVQSMWCKIFFTMKPGLWCKNLCVSCIEKIYSSRVPRLRPEQVAGFSCWEFSGHDASGTWNSSWQ